MIKPRRRRVELLKHRQDFLADALTPSRPLRILDIGANPVHTPPYQRLLDAGLCHVTGFEPQAEAYAALMEQPQDNRTYLQAAVGPSGPAKLNIYPTDGFSSLYELDDRALGYLQRFRRQVRKVVQIDVELTPMDALADLGPVDVLKMDVQGAERDIILGGERTLADTVCIVTELRYYRLYRDEPTLGDLDGELRRQGFVLHKFLPPAAFHLSNSQSGRAGIAALRNQIVDGDAIYMRSLEAPNTVSDDQLMHLAIAADSLFDSADLALRLLDHLVARGSIPKLIPKAYADVVLGEHIYAPDHDD